jgi:hypothetical protein
LRLEIALDEVLNVDLQNVVEVRDLDRLELNQITEHLLERCLQGELQRGRELWAVAFEDHLQQPAAEGGPVDAFALIGEEQLADEIADVVVTACAGGSPAAIDLKWKCDIHFGLTFL